MEKQEFYVRHPLWVKLMASLSLLTVILVALLSTAALFVVLEDKRAYVYQVQLLEAYVSSRQLSEKTTNLGENLKLFLSSVDPRQSINPEQKAVLKNLINNQDLADQFSIGWLKDGVYTEVVSENKTSAPRITDGTSKQVFSASLQNSLLKQPFVLMDSVGEGKYFVGIFLDQKIRDAARGYPVALGWVPSEKMELNTRLGFSAVLGRNGNTILNQSGLDLSNLLKSPSWGLFMEGKVAAGSHEFSIAGEEYLGAYQRNEFGPIIIHFLSWEKVIQSLFDLAMQLFGIGMAGIALSILAAWFFSKSISGPINRLFQAVKQIASGDFNVDPHIETQDEVGQLGNAFIIMSQKIQDLLVETRKKAQLEEELKIAATVQENLLPPSAVQSRGLKIESYYRSAMEFGGDWWGVLEQGGKSILVIADATGHGISSALLTACMKSTFSMLQKFWEGGSQIPITPNEIMQYSHRVIYEATHSKLMMTMFCVVVDVDKKQLTFANAGHNAAWLFSKDGAAFKLKSLIHHGARLGESNENQSGPASLQWEEITLPYQPGDYLFLYTDGLMENRDATGATFGKKRVRGILESELLSGAKAAVDKITQEMNDFNGGNATEDDVTVIIAELGT